MAIVEGPLRPPSLPLLVVTRPFVKGVGGVEEEGEEDEGIAFEEEDGGREEDGDCDCDERGRGSTEVADRESRVLGDSVLVVGSCGEDGVVAMSNVVDFDTDVEEAAELAVPSASNVVYLSSFVPLRSIQSTL